MLSKNITSTLIFFIIFTFTLEAQDCSIKIKVTGISEITGKLSIGLFNNPNDFLKKNDRSLGKELVITNKSMEYTFSKLKKGEYAIAVYHDKNSNGKLDKSFWGLPTEDYVFSNYATGSFGPPSFDDAKFLLVDSLFIILEIK